MFCLRCMTSGFAEPRLVCATYSTPVRAWDTAGDAMVCWSVSHRAGLDGANGHHIVTVSNISNPASPGDACQPKPRQAGERSKQVKASSSAPDSDEAALAGGATW
jgi:hypothetical protein